MYPTKKILIIGATGIVGKAVIKVLYADNQENEIIAAVRNLSIAKQTFVKYPRLQYRTFDMENPGTFSRALSHVSTVFLLRPSHISNVPAYFSPLIEAFKTENVKEIVFLSVQGAEKSRIIPHNKIERLIRDSGIQYTFLRPSYFMQNLTTGLLEDIKLNNQIYVPAGKAIFNWVDVQDIGSVAAIILTQFERHINKTYELTGTENLSFHQVAQLLSSQLHQKVIYKSPSLVSFYRRKRKQGMHKQKAIIMLLLHFIARFHKPLKISNNIFEITGNKPLTLVSFIHREKDNLTLH